MKKITAIIMAADVVFSLAACGTHRRAQKIKVEPIREVISEEVSSYMEEVKKTNKKISEKVEDSFKCKTSKQNSTQSYNPYVKNCLGMFSLTFYIPDAKWGYSTSTGARSVHLQTCAVDPSVIPYGSVIQITGDNGQVLILKCVDCGNGIIGNKIDIFYDSNNYGGVQAGYDWLASFGTIQSVYLLEE